MKTVSNIKKAGIVFLCLIVTLILAGWYINGNDEREAQAGIVAEKVLIPGGLSIGVKMDVSGVLIVGLEDIKTRGGKFINPGLEAGLQIGDSVLEINDTPVKNAEEVKAFVNKTYGNVMLKIQRKDKIKKIRITPVRAADDNTYKLGIWVKDRTAGIGTLTYYDPDTGKYGALGHGIVDGETGEILKVENGELLQAEVQSIKEGKVGSPGEIKGIFYEADHPLGTLDENTNFGISGNLYEPFENLLYSKPLVVGLQDQVEKGKAYILTTIDGKSIDEYEIDIEKINRQNEPDTKSMVIRVTDERLLAKSGGIVQGMSGSPIIQNNRIIGAVTHVFVNNPEKGYGIFIEWMLNM